MKRKRWMVWLMLILMMLTGFLSSCESGGEKIGMEEAVAQAPVTIVVNSITPMTDQEFDTLFAQPVKSKYPNITLEHKKGGNLGETVASGNIPDIFTTWNGGAPDLMQFNLLDDMTPLIKKQNIDLSRFDDTMIKAITVLSPKGEIYGLPYQRQISALYYNKDLFNRFGVDYPKDGMIWEDAIELGRKLSRVEDGVQYRGLDPERIYRLAFPLSLNYVDPVTNKALVNGPEWRKVVQLAYQIYSIPNNNPTQKKVWGTGLNGFIKDKNVAMLGSVNLIPQLEEAGANAPNWDIAQYPSYKDKPNVDGMVDAHYAFISKVSKHKDAAIKVLEVLTSDDVQLKSVSTLGNASPLKDKKYKENFASDMPSLKGKNLPAFFKSTPSFGIVQSKYNNKSMTILDNKFEDYLSGTKDLNTILRESEEEINKYVEADLTK